MDEPSAICHPKGHRCAPQEKDEDGVLEGAAADTVAEAIAEAVGSAVMPTGAGVPEPGAEAVALTVNTALCDAVRVPPEPVLVGNAERVADPERLYDPDADADREQGRDAPISHTAEL